MAFYSLGALGTVDISPKTISVKIQIPWDQFAERYAGEIKNLSPGTITSLQGAFMNEGGAMSNNETALELDQFFKKVQLALIKKPFGPRRQPTKEAQELAKTVEAPLMPLTKGHMTEAQELAKMFETPLIPLTKDHSKTLFSVSRLQSLLNALQEKNERVKKYFDAHVDYFSLRRITKEQMLAPVNEVETIFRDAINSANRGGGTEITSKDSAERPIDFVKLSMNAHQVLDRILATPITSIMLEQARLHHELDEEKRSSGGSIGDRARKISRLYELEKQRVIEHVKRFDQQNRNNEERVLQTLEDETSACRTPCGPCAKKGSCIVPNMLTPYHFISTQDQITSLYISSVTGSPVDEDDGRRGASFEEILAEVGGDPVALKKILDKLIEHEILYQLENGRYKQT